MKCVDAQPGARRLKVSNTAKPESFPARTCRPRRSNSIGDPLNGFTIGVAGAVKEWDGFAA
jgi:hypothetical protein